MRKFPRFIGQFASMSAALSLSACGGGSSPPSQSASPSPLTPIPANVTISGAVTFDFVPTSTISGLDYAGVARRAARGVVVEAVNGAGAAIASATTNSSGQYSLAVPSNTSVRIRVTSQMRETTIATWNVAVRDNTNGDALYALEGALVSSGAANSTRNLNAPSGWTGAGYTATRAAAPFAILDTIYSALTATNQAAGGGSPLVFPPLRVYWSTRNRAMEGDLTQGEIESTSYAVRDGVPTILLQGAADIDTDEYDRLVVAHEFGHYIEDQLSRSDSIGGEHGVNDLLDARVAFSEGWATAFAGIAFGDINYIDTFGPSQSQSFRLNIETGSGRTKGWYNEASVYGLIYDFFDTANETADSISVGASRIFSALLNADHRRTPAPQSVFTYVQSILADPQLAAGEATGVAQRLAADSISGTGPYGDGEANSGGIPTALPVVKTVAIGAGAINICSLDDLGEFNSLGNRTLIRLNVPSARSLTFRMVLTSGPAGRDPDFVIYDRGQISGVGGSAAVDIETLTITLTGGDYFIDAYDFGNIDEDTPNADVCFDFSVN